MVVVVVVVVVAQLCLPAQAWRTMLRSPASATPYSHPPTQESTRTRSHTLPTCVRLQQGEDISEAAEREVLEETGVRATFDGVLAMRQAHGFAFGKSDLFCVVALKLQPGPQVGLGGIEEGAGPLACRFCVSPHCLTHLPCPSPSSLSPLSPPPPRLPLRDPPTALPHPSHWHAPPLWLPPLQELRMQEDELVGVQWMPLEEYLAVPFTASRPLYRQIHAVCVAYANGTYR